MYAKCDRSKYIHITLKRENRMKWTWQLSFLTLKYASLESCYCFKRIWNQTNIGISKLKIKSIFLFPNLIKLWLLFSSWVLQSWQWWMQSYMRCSNTKAVMRLPLFLQPVVGLKWMNISLTALIIINQILFDRKWKIVNDVYNFFSLINSSEAFWWQSK